MMKIAKVLKIYWMLILVIIGGVTAGIFSLLFDNSPFFLSAQFSFDGADLAHYIIVALSAVIVISMSIEMIKTIAHGSYGIDILAITAIIACLLLGEYWAAYVIMLMLCGGEALENYAIRRARRELSTLIKRRSTKAHLVSRRGITEVSLNQVNKGDTLLIKPGEVVPIDGILQSESATIDESSITGESMPVNKKQCDKVISGTTNFDTAIQIRTTCTAANSYYSQIIKLVQEAESQPAHFVNMANRYAVPFTLISYLIAGLAWYLSGDAARFAEVLVVASPCPLILAAPIAFVSGMSLSSRHGVIVKNGTTLEQIARAKTFCFDKTGTLTTGQLAVDLIETSGNYTEKDIIAIMAAAENLSNHVMATAIINKANTLRAPKLEARNVREVAGGGIFATVAGKRIVVGSRKFLTENKIPNLPPCDLSSTEIMLAVSGKYAGAVHLSDQLRPEAASVINKLKQLGVKHLAMLTGDRVEVAHSVARCIGINEVHARLTPDGKYRYVKQAAKQGTVVMVGDGINDAPVLAIANVGIAMGTNGSSAASESADAVVTVGDLSRVTTLRQIAQHTVHIARQSVLTGMVLCIVLELIATTGVIPAIIGAGLQELIDVVVILNALRVGRLKV